MRSGWLLANGGQAGHDELQSRLTKTAIEHEITESFFNRTCLRHSRPNAAHPFFGSDGVLLVARTLRLESKTAFHACVAEGLRSAFA